MSLPCLASPTSHLLRLLDFTLYFLIIDTNVGHAKISFPVSTWCFQHIFGTLEQVAEKRVLFLKTFCRGLTIVLTPLN